jgi:hypothetical protein
MKGRTRRVELIYRTQTIVVHGKWYEDDSLLTIGMALHRDKEGGVADCWPLIEGTAVAEELTAACREVLLREDAERDREMRETKGMGEAADREGEL